MLKHLPDILPQPTAHGVGQKHVLLKQAETHANQTMEFKFEIYDINRQKTV